MDYNGLLKKYNLLLKENQDIHQYAWMSGKKEFAINLQ